MEQQNQSQQPQYPNILWFSMEDTSPRFGCYGDTVARTPNLDALAAQGRLYNRAFCTSGVCAPSRASIITGCYATHIGAHHMRTSGTLYAYECVPPPYVKCFTEYFRAAGYFCTNNHKTDYQFQPPRTAWDELGESAHWRNRSNKSQPFFAVFNPTGTHESGMWPREATPLTDPAALEVPPFLPDTPLVRTTLARQYDNIAHSDILLGELISQLKEDGVWDNTIIVVWSDHGEGLPRAKRTPYDSGTRIPLLVRAPGITSNGETTDQLVSLLDLAPTMLSLAGLPLPCHLQGQPFLGPQSVERDYVFAHRDRQDPAYDMRRSVRDQRFRYVRNFYPGAARFNWEPYAARHEAMQEARRLWCEGALKGPPAQLFEPYPPEELYDLHNDPFELENLTQNPAFASDLKRLRGVLDEWRRDFDRFGDWDEMALMNFFWPSGVRPQTRPVHFIPWSENYDGQAPQASGALTGPVMLQMQSDSQGASIAYTTEESENARWQLYTLPIRLESGAISIRARAIRIGFEESEETRADYQVSHL